jgi:hypothetical protein
LELVTLLILFRMMVITLSTINTTIIPELDIFASNSKSENSRDNSRGKVAESSPNEVNDFFQFT